MFAALLAVLIPGVQAAVVPIPRAYSHNDYLQARPLFDALDRGFCGVEADVHLKDGQLLIGHKAGDVKPGVTLRSLYLDPLLARVRANGGRVYRGGPSVLLMVEFKTDGEKAWPVLREMLEPYAEMLTVFTPTTVEWGAVTLVITGHTPIALLRAEPRRLAALDYDGEGPLDPREAMLFPVISHHWGPSFIWRKGRMTTTERTRLDGLVRAAHAQERLIRFWGTPDTPETWTLLRNAGVDLITTDHLEALKQSLQLPTPGELVQQVKRIVDRFQQQVHDFDVAHRP